jgi:hypothetical protein
MRAHVLVAFLLSVSLLSFGPTADAIDSSSLADPRQIIEAAKPFYNFNAPTLKPFHLKVAYQLYDRKGKPSEQGAYEYWWASSQVYRSSWTRPGATRTDWHTADGHTTRLATGEALKYFEKKLQSLLMSPLADLEDLDPSRFRLDRVSLPANNIKFPCIAIMMLEQPNATSPPPPESLSPVYCFDTETPVLWAVHSFGIVTAEFKAIVKMQDHYLPREILITGAKQNILSAAVNTISGLSPSDPALTPALNAFLVNEENPPPSSVFSGLTRIRTVKPVYQPMARSAHEFGTVIRQAVIGMNGAVRDPQVILAPSASLADSALEAVSQWVYKPRLVHRKPVEEDLIVSLTYRSGY